MSDPETDQAAGDDASKGPDDKGGDKAPEMSTAETTARKDGWKPESEYGDDEDKPPEFFSAEVFNVRGHFIKEHKRQEKRITDLQAEFNTRLGNTKKLHDAQLKIQKEELEGKRDEAIKLADVDAATKIQTQIDNINSLPADEPAAAADPTQVRLEEWNQANAWIFQNNPKSAYAKAQLQSYATAGQDVDTALASMERDVAREFPNKATNQENQPAVEGGTKPGGKRGAVKLTMADITSEEKKFRAAMPTAWKNDAEFLQAVQDARSE